MNNQQDAKRVSTFIDAPKTSDTTLAAFIWKNAEDLWGDFKHTDFGKIILPFTLLRRLECVLEPTRDAVRKANETFKAKGLDTDLILRQTASLPFYNTSLYSLATLGATKTKSNLDAYIAGFSDNARVIFEQFNFSDTIARLARAEILFKICQNFANTDLHPDVVPDRVMSNIYEHLIRRFGAEVNEAAEDFMTPRDVVHLATTLLLDPDDALFRNNPGIIRTLYDPTCGTGGFLTDAMNHVDGYTAAGKAPPVLIPFGQELEPETHAVALASMLLRRLETEHARDLSANIAGPKSTLSQDTFSGRHFHYCLSNPPFGKKWEKDQAFVEREAKEKGFDGRFGAGTPRVSDGSMLFIQHLIDKLERPANGGGRAAIILSGSPLFTGNAGQGESEIRRWLLENDYIEAIVALPNDIFFRTGLGTYVWLLTNNKPKVRKHKVQLIDATGLHTPMRKPEGNKRRYLTDEQIQTIARLYANFEDGENVRIANYRDFGYRRIKILRPLRLIVKIAEGTLAALQASKPFMKLDEAEQAGWLALLRKELGHTHPYSWLATLPTAANKAGLGKVAKSLASALESALGVRDPHAPEVWDEDGDPVPDKDLEDFENVPLDQGVDEYVAAEVLPHLPDAWVDPSYKDEHRHSHLYHDRRYRQTRPAERSLRTIMHPAFTDTAHREKYFEDYIVKQLALRGWQVGDTAGYDQNYALYPEDLVTWVRATQPKRWEKLVAGNGDKATNALMDRLARALEKEGTVHVLRRGIKVAGAGEISLSEGLPEDERDPSAWERYNANVLRVVPQLRYRPGSQLAIDLVFFINGIPVATVEVKTDFTQSAEAAMEQYKNDRLPDDKATGRKEPLLTFKRGAVVHFAISDSDIQMTTKLAGPDTYFIPFNQGRDGHAGNPLRADGEYPVAHFWEQICQRDNWLRIFHSFVYTEKKDVVSLDSNHHKKETSIFPRFHQWDAVTRMIDDAKANGPGKPYLCEHSAGSGKTSTIAWTAHDLIRLRTPEGVNLFHSVIVVTDRTVLDKQLQDAVQQIDHQHDLIAAIGDKDTGKSKSAELAEALERQTPIIVVTIQTFPYAIEQILTDGKLANRNFAVIIDEAHTSQTGTAASKLQATLALRDAQAMEGLTVEELLEKIQASRVRPKNVSYFAFTATPKHSTLTLFGRLADPNKPASKDNLPVSFHKYPMRQAIEERFILDVLAGYLPYKTAFNLAEPEKDGKRIDSKSAKRALAKWLSLHATNVTQKVEFIVEHFAANVAPLLGGTAKGMIVTSSRAAAVRYKRAFDAYIETHFQHQALRALVAFSGSLTGKEVKHPSDDNLEHDPFAAQDDDQFTENSMNPRQYGSDLRKVFDRPEFRVIIVANKFQTGFDQPKLCAMYLDKKIANPVEIVQTLSRLNRTAPGKDTTFVVDFVNDPQVVLDAFAKYDAGARIHTVQDPNVVYDLQGELDKAGIYTPAEVEAFTAVRFKSAAAYAAGDRAQHKELYAATSAPTERFNDLLRKRRAEIQTAEAAFEAAKTQGNEAAMKAADAQRNESAESLQKLIDFKSGLARFGTLYTYIAQTIDFGDASLEAFASFARLLSKRLDGVPPDQVDVSALLLTGFDIKPQDKPDPGQADEEALILKPVGPGGGGQAPLPVYLRQVIARLNSIFGEATPLTDKVAFVNHIADIAREDANTVAQVENNPRDVAMSGNIKGTVQSAVVRAMQSHSDLAEHVMKNDHLAMAPLVALVYDMIKSGTNIDASTEGATFKAKPIVPTQEIELSDADDIDLR